MGSAEHWAYLVQDAKADGARWVDIWVEEVRLELALQQQEGVISALCCANTPSALEVTSHPTFGGFAG